MQTYPQRVRDRILPLSIADNPPEAFEIGGRHAFLRYLLHSQLKQNTIFRLARRNITAIAIADLRGWSYVTGSG